MYQRKFLFEKDDEVVQPSRGEELIDIDFDDHNPQSQHSPQVDTTMPRGKLLSIEGIQYDFHVLDLKSQLRQYRNLSVFAPNHSTASLHHTEKIKRIMEEMREVKDSSTVVHAHYNNVGLDKLMREKYVRDYRNQKEASTLPTAGAILFTECLKRNIIPFAVKDFVHSKNYKVLYEKPERGGSDGEDKDKQMEGEEEEEGHEGATASTDSQFVGETKTDSLLSEYSSTNHIACAVENNEVVSIDLKNRGIGNERGLCLAEALKYCPALLVLNISGNRLNDRTLTTILIAVHAYTNCSSFDISDNAMEQNSLLALIQCIEVRKRRR